MLVDPALASRVIEIKDDQPQTTSWEALTAVRAERSYENLLRELREECPAAKGLTLSEFTLACDLIARIVSKVQLHYRNEVSGTALEESQIDHSNEPELRFRGATKYGPQILDAMPEIVDLNKIIDVSIDYQGILKATFDGLSEDDASHFLKSGKTFTARLVVALLEKEQGSFFTYGSDGERMQLGALICRYYGEHRQWLLQHRSEVARDLPKNMVEAAFVPAIMDLVRNATLGTVPSFEQELLHWQRYYNRAERDSSLQEPQVRRQIALSFARSFMVRHSVPHECLNESAEVTQLLDGITAEAEGNARASRVRYTQMSSISPTVAVQCEPRMRLDRYIVETLAENRSWLEEFLKS